MIKITENIVEYKGIGAVKYIYNRKARNFTIRINQKGEVRVTIPRFGRQKQAEAFLFGKSDWVKAKLQDIEKKNAHILVLKEGKELRIRDKRFVLSAAKNGKDIESAFWTILLNEAKQVLPERVKDISERFALPYQGLKIKKMKSRWGSCTPGNSINLNSWLVLVPDHLIDYVILHELTHTIHKDHSKRFWIYLDKLCGGKALSLRKELRQYPISYRVE